jgi:hypothetical protein
VAKIPGAIENCDNSLGGATKTKEGPRTGYGWRNWVWEANSRS